MLATRTDILAAAPGSMARAGDVREQAFRRWLARLEVRSPVDEADRAAVLGLPGRVETYGSGRDVVALGERTTHCCLVADGLVARFGQTVTGNRQFTAFYLPGDMGDLHSAVLPRVTAALQSALRATVVFVPHDAVLALGDRFPRLRQAVWRDCVADAQVGSEWMLNNGRRDALARVAHLLCELSYRYEGMTGERDWFPMDFTQAHLADATSLTAVHVNRILRELREAGAIRSRERRFDVLDRDRLARIGEFDPAYLHLERERTATAPAAPLLAGLRGR